MSFLKSIILCIASISALTTFAHHIPVDQWDYIPQVHVELIKDTHSGWNLKVSSENFIFDAANAGNAHQIGHGHGHLYVNGKKVTRIYSEWTHIPTSWLSTGHNKIEVTLNANTHEELRYRDITISDSQMIFYDGVQTGGGHHHR